MDGGVCRVSLFRENKIIVGYPGDVSVDSNVPPTQKKTCQICLKNYLRPSFLVLFVRLRYKKKKENGRQLSTSQAYFEGLFVFCLFAVFFFFFFLVNAEGNWS